MLLQHDAPRSIRRVASRRSLSLDWVGRLERFISTAGARLGGIHASQLEQGLRRRTPREHGPHAPMRKPQHF